MGRYLVKINELKEKNNYINNNIASIRDCVIALEAAKNNVRWTGSARDSFISKYDEYINNLKRIVIHLEACYKVTKKYEENYSEEYNKIKNRFKNVTDSMEE